MWRAFTVKGTCRKHPCTEQVVFRVAIGPLSCYSSLLLFSRFRLQVLRGSPAMLPERCPLQAGAAARPVQLQLCSSCKHQLRWDLQFILENVLVCFHTGNHHKTSPANKKQVLLTVEPKIIFTLGVCTKWKEAIQKWLRVLTCCSVSRVLETDRIAQQSK